MLLWDPEDFSDLPTGRAVTIGQVMLLWDPEDSASETHFMGLDLVLLRGLVIHSIDFSDLPTGKVLW